MVRLLWSNGSIVVESRSCARGAEGRSGVNQQALADGIDQVVIPDFRDHRRAEALAFADQQESVRAVKAVG